MSLTMSERWTRAAFATAAGVLFALAGSPDAASAQALLPGGSTIVNLAGNDFQCGLSVNGDVCANAFNSPTDPGGFWPTGSPNAYMFNSGIQLAGIVEDQAGNPWAGDTVGAFFFDASGLQQQGEQITNIWNSLDQEDLANWPQAGAIAQFPDLSAYVTDTDLFSDVLIGRPAASQQDSWFVIWDGNPAITGGREHPMGLLVEQRTLAWNYPAGNEGTIYFIWNVTNVTNSQYFQTQSERQFFGGANALPDAGWAFHDVYMAYSADPDVTADAGANYATGILPFNMGITYDANFTAGEFVYPPSIFSPPFYVNAPGIVGVKYLKSPINPATGNEVGLTLFSVYTNGGPFPDARGTQQLWRYLSGNIRPDLGDPDCNISGGDPQARRVCWLPPTQRDVRFFQSSGPFTLNPGETVTVVSAMFAAPTVSGTVNVGSFSNAPPNSADAPSVHPGCFGAPITFILEAAGWISTDQCPANPGEPVDIFDVNTVEGSLLFKAQVAQAVFDGNFLLPFAPDPPQFYTLAGDSQVTVVWEPSPSEQTGDPFYQAASDPTSPLYNPNFREFDVEGYRVYRSTDNTNFDLIAQFDYAGSTFTDFTCETDPTFAAGDTCAGTPVVIDLNGDFVQYPAGGVVRTNQGNLLIVEADTVELANTGIPFVYVDEDVRNGFEYYYRVTAFDVNSLASGPSSLESASLPSQRVIPQPNAAGIVADSVRATVNILLGDGTILDPTDDQTLDATTGQFSGPPPPTGALSGIFEAVVPQLLSEGATVVAMSLDSVVPAYYAGTYFFSDAAGQAFSVGPIQAPNASGSFTGVAGPATVAADTQKRDSLIAAGATNVPTVAGQIFTELYIPNTLQWHSGDADWAYSVCGFWVHCPPAGAVAGGSRWFDGGNEAVADPTIGLAHGALTGVNDIFEPMPYIGMTNYAGFSSDLMRRFYQFSWAARRVADMEIRFGAAGTAPEVFDVTHQVAVPFSTHARASYGFRNDADADGVITYGDFWRTPGIVGVDWSGLADTPLSDTPVLTNVDIDGDLASDGPGFAIYIAGEPFIFQTAAIPTNTTWTLRTHSGVVEAPGAGGPYVHWQPSNEPAGVDLIRTPGVPGLQIAATIDQSDVFYASAIDLEDIRVVPDPYYGASQFDLSPAARQIRFMNLPPQASLRIYTVSGVLVDVINHESLTGGSLATWDLRNRSGQFVASGVYFYHVTTPQGLEHTGKFTIVTTGFAQ